ncbi:hypothetical protein B7486_70430, partial [cyanobacterium TDX16]
MPSTEGADRSQQRLREELEDDGIVLTVPDEATAALVVAELDHARRTPMFEGRQPTYGALITPTPESVRSWDGMGVDLVDLPGELDEARRYADGRGSYLVRSPDAPASIALACFDRSLLMEAELVRLQEATGALVVQ